MKPNHANRPGTRERLNVLSPRAYKGADGEERSAYTRVGVAFPLRHKPGYKLHLDAVPFHGELLLLPAHSEKEATS